MSQRICAVRLPGTSRARFADAASLPVNLGDWVALDTGAGEEPGQVVVAPDQWVEPVSMEDVPSLVRVLQSDELNTVARNIERAHELIPGAAQRLRELNDNTYLTGLRLTLNAETAVVSVRGPDRKIDESTELNLGTELGVSVILEHEFSTNPESSLLSGSTGLPDQSTPATFREMLESRIDALREPGAFAPHGIPRLNTPVATPQGTGRLLAVDIRHWKATVQLHDGEEITLSVNVLGEP